MPPSADTQPCGTHISVTRDSAGSILVRVGRTTINITDELVELQHWRARAGAAEARLAAIRTWLVLKQGQEALDAIARELQ